MLLFVKDNPRKRLHTRRMHAIPTDRVLEHDPVVDRDYKSNGSPENRPSRSRPH